MYIATRGARIGFKKKGCKSSYITAVSYSQLGMRTQTRTRDSSIPCNIAAFKLELGFSRKVASPTSPTRTFHAASTICSFGRLLLSKVIKKKIHKH